LPFDGAGRKRRVLESPRIACFCGKFIVSRSRAGYDAQASGLLQEFRIREHLDGGSKRKFGTALLLVALFASLIAFFLHPAGRQGEYILRGQVAENIHFTVDGRSERLSDLRGKVVVLNFWATWCAPCVDETPSLVALQKRIAPLDGTVLGVSLDDNQEAYLDFLKTFQINFPTYRDPTKKSALDFGTTKYPETYIITRRGRIDRKIVGPQDWISPEMTVYMDSVLKSK
jgi:cytochrome c biogenesis protein CcmG, thiol:disulfide interchange protein DsbE